MLPATPVTPTPPGCMTDWTLDTPNEPDPADLDALHDGLRAYNFASLGPHAFDDYKVIAAFARSPGGAIIGGVYGELMWEWLYIRILWVDEEHRGQSIGAQLMQAIEQAALDHGVGHVHLETTSFQALDFYLRHGYTIFGEIKNKPTGHDWYFLQKALV